MREKVYEDMIKDLFWLRGECDVCVTLRASVELRNLLKELPEEEKLILGYNYHLEKISGYWIDVFYRDNSYTDRLHIAQQSYVKKLNDSGIDVNIFCAGNEESVDLYIDLYRKFRKHKEEVKKYRKILQEDMIRKANEALEARGARGALYATDAYSLRIADLPIKRCVKAAFGREGIHYVDQLGSFTQKDILKLDGIGPDRLKEFLDCLSKYGIVISEE